MTIPVHVWENPVTLFGKRHRMVVLLVCSSLAMATSGISAAPPADAKQATPPAVGDDAPDFEFESIGGKAIKISESTETGPVVLVMLRGYPGYQCPLCTAQVAQFLARAKDFRRAKATVLLVYPGPADDLKKHAAEFAGERKLPENFQLLLDPNYEFTKSWGLRWDAPRETAYPATFVIDSKRKVRFAKVSKTHGDRASAEQVLKALESL
jgi:peroxiredoxin